jgi:hypothetical protein
VPIYRAAVVEVPAEEVEEVEAAVPVPAEGAAAVAAKAAPNTI